MHLFTNLILYIALSFGIGYVLRSIKKKEDGTPDDDLILTAETKALREFLLKHLQDAEAFNEVDELRRVKP